MRKFWGIFGDGGPPQAEIFEDLGGVLRRKHVPECVPATCFLCTTSQKSPKNFRLRRALTPWGARDILKKIACGGHSGSLFRFAEPAPIGRSPAKRKNAREPAFVRSGFIFHVCGGQNIFVCFINSFLFVKRFFRAFGPTFSAGRVYQMLAAGGKF